ncbi:MAG: hypothetical protein ACK5P7_12920 [Bdellovibrio sp.]|jgi:hypothetical protein
MKRFAYLAMAVLLPVTSLAQSNYTFDDEVNAELEKMYQGQGTSSSNSGSNPIQAQTGPQVQVNVATNQGTTVTPTQTAPVVAQVAPVSQPVAVTQPTTVIDQPIAVSAPIVQKQETTVISATPLKESKAEQIRKSRQDAEISTEQNIVVKLEESRLEDEKRRSEVLFGDKFQTLQGQNALINNSPNSSVIQQQETIVAPAVATPVIATPVIVTEAPVVVSAPVKHEDRDDVRGEVRASIQEMKEEKKSETRSYFSGLAGLGDYPDVKNVRGNYSLGFSFGQKFNDRLLAEGSFLYSNFDVEQREGVVICNPGCVAYPRITRMDQYAGSAQMKYQLLGGMIRPVIGGALAYVYRTFSDSQFGNSSNYAQSHALDLGLVTGVDVEFSEKFTIGLDARYMWNMTNRSQTSGFQQSFSQSVYGSDTPIEQLSYMNISLVGRATF